MYYWLAFFSVLLLGMIACNAAKQVMKNPNLLEKVGREWEKNNPCVNDTVVRVIPGKVTYVPVKELISPDTNELKKRADSIARIINSRYKYDMDLKCAREINDAFDAGYNQALRENVKQQSPDTVLRTIEDTRRLKISNDSVDYYRRLSNFNNEQVKQLKAERKSVGANLKYLFLSIISQWWFWIIITALGAWVWFKGRFLVMDKIYKLFNK